MTLYIRRNIHQRMAHTIPTDLEIASIGISGASVTETADITDLASMDFIIFKSMDVLPKKSRSTFANIMGNLFR